MQLIIIAILTKALMTYIVILSDHKTHSLVESTLGILIKNTSQSYFLQQLI